MTRHGGSDLDPAARRHVCGRCGMDAAVARCDFCSGYFCRRCWRLACRPQKLRESEVFQPQLF